jgi:hypothetical protein
MDHSACPIVPCLTLTWNACMNAQLGFGQSSSHHRRRGFPARIRHLARLAFSHHAPVPSRLSVEGKVLLYSLRYQ